MRSRPLGRRAVLRRVTGGGVLFAGALIGLAVLRGLERADNNFYRMDLSDMPDGSLRSYAFDDITQIVLRDGASLTVFDGACPVHIDQPTPLQPIQLRGARALECPHCGSRFAPDGRLLRFRDGSSDPTDAPDLTSGEIATRGLSLSIARYRPRPTLVWSL